MKDQKDYDEKFSTGKYIMQRMMQDSEATRIQMYRKFLAHEKKLRNPNQKKVDYWTKEIENHENRTK